MDLSLAGRKWEYWAICSILLHFQEEKLLILQKAFPRLQVHKCRVHFIGRQGSFGISCHFTPLGPYQANVIISQHFSLMQADRVNFFCGLRVLSVRQTASAFIFLFIKGVNSRSSWMSPHSIDTLFLRWYEPDLVKINGLWLFVLLFLMGLSIYCALQEGVLDSSEIYNTSWPGWADCKYKNFIANKDMVLWIKRMQKERYSKFSTVNPSCCSNCYVSIWL